jgi:Holliday junction resolvase
MAWFDDPKTLMKIAFAVYGDVCSIDTSEAPEGEEKLRARIAAIHAGLAPENEFFVQAAWLGNCEAINRIDQTPAPISGEKPTLRAPDFLLVARYQGRLIPVLIEVKATDDDKLVWSESYLKSLTDYAALLRIPLLVAWKRGSMWTLNDVRHFEKKVDAFHLTTVKAMMENLMSMLLGETFVVLTEEFKFVFEAEVEQELPEDIGVLAPPGHFTMTLKDAGFFHDGTRLKALEPEYVWLFMASSDHNTVERITRQRIKVIFATQDESMFPMFHALLSMTMWGVRDGEDPDWNEIIRKQPIAITGSQFRKALEAGIAKGLVRYVLHQRPQTVPDFLT